MISTFRPRYIIMVGIAAGVGKDKFAGDIIVPTVVWNYSSGKYITANQGDENVLIDFLPDPSSLPLDPLINSVLSDDFKEVLSQIKEGYGGAPDNRLSLIKGPMACGSAVVANKQIVDKLVVSVQRKTVGLDMESYGLFSAAFYKSGVDTLPLCFKSICDFADADKDNSMQKYAAYTSVQFMKYCVENLLEYKS